MSASRDVGPVTVADLAAVTDVGPPTDGRHRRAVGGLLLVTGAVAILLARAFLAPGLPGVAVPAPWPAPPTVGSCVVLDVDRVERVPCDEPHSGEVVAAWPVGEQPQPMLEGDATARPVTVSVSRTLPVWPQDEVCRSWVEQYTGWTSVVATQRWSGRWIAPQPVVAGTLVVAPSAEGTPDRHWTACVVQTQRPLYTGTVRSAASRTAGLPAELSICINVGVTAADFVGCDQPHTIELLAMVALSTAMMMNDTIAVEHTAAEMHKQCVDLAAGRTGAADPSYGGQLEVVTESAWVQRELPVQVSPPGWLIPDCLVRVAGSGQLVGSVVGLGDRALPWLN